MAIALCPTVYVLQGWFGDVEWIEGIYSDETEAEDRCDALWVERTSSVLPADHYAQKLCKFAVAEFPLL